MINMNDQSRYHLMIKALRARLVDEETCMYLLHTPLGVINVGRWVYTSAGFVEVSGQDEKQRNRFFVFSEETICSYPLEVKRKTGTLKEPLGFKPTPGDLVEDQI
jgi:hypothetical protein